MYSKIRRKIISFLNSKSAPYFLSALYFKRIVASRRKELLSARHNGIDLMDLVSETERQHWGPRIDDVLNCTDNQDISRDKLAGSFVGNNLFLNHGIKIDPLSYYSFPMLKMLIENKGIHEPQEEKIFQEVLKSLPENGNKTMIELGAYWSYYSLWFKKAFPNANCYMVEPSKINLFYGKTNFNLNKITGKFIHAGIGKENQHKYNITTVDAICKKQKINFIDILHSDIQGYEFEMLHGSDKMLSDHKVGYIFISTHSNELHNDCLELLKNKYGYSLIASADLNETYSWDGVLVMKSPSYSGIEKVAISKKIT